jgi:transcriptional antiterminator RfaH
MMDGGVTREGATWYVVRTRPRAEQTAFVNLARQGFEVFLPRHRKRRYHAGRIEEVSVPLFPSYLFVAFDAARQRWRAINSTIGVQRLVGHGDAPTPVPPRVVESLLVRRGVDGLILLDPAPRFAPGDAVRVVNGVFSDCFGLYEGTDDRHRVAILLDLLGRKVRVSADAASVAAA